MLVGTVMTQRPSVGALLREWRERRRVSQERLAEKAFVSTRHLSYVENGRAHPSREVLLLLASELDIPAPEHNRLLLAAGYAPSYVETSFEGAEIAAVRGGLERLLAGHEWLPAIVIDRRWHVLARNPAAAILAEGVGQELLEPPVNALRLALHPNGLAQRITNFEEWSAYLLRRLDRQIQLTADPSLEALAVEVHSYVPADVANTARRPKVIEAPFLSLRLEYGGQELQLLNLVARFDTLSVAEPADLTFEAFYPADDVTARVLRSKLVPTRSPVTSP